MKRFYLFLLAVTLLFSVCFSGCSWKSDEPSSEKVRVHFSDLSDESIDAEFEAGGYISAWIEFDYPAMDMSLLEGLDKQDRHEVLRSYYLPRNTELANELAIPIDSISDSSPFAEVTFSTIEAYETAEAHIYDIAESEHVEDIDIFLHEINESTKETDTLVDSIVRTMSSAWNDIGFADNNSYDGDGIKVGVLEAGVPTTTSHVPSGKITINNATGVTSNHTDMVVETIGGYYGIASDVTFYCTNMDVSASLMTGFNWLLSQDVDIINISAGWRVGSPVYDNRSAYIDSWIMCYSCLVVKSAGNEDMTQYITSPGFALNALTVGATNAAGRVSAYSSYITNISNAAKPDLVAPGGAFDYVTSNESFRGTSFAAPMVTGIAARLMDEFPVLIDNPALLKAVLLASCEPVTGQTTLRDTYAGRGMVNYENARSIMLSNDYGQAMPNSFVLGNQSYAGQNLTIPANTTITVDYSVLIYGDDFALTTEEPIGQPIFSVYTVTIYAEDDIRNPHAVLSIQSPQGVFQITNDLDESEEYIIIITTSGGNALTLSQKMALTYRDSE